MLFFLNRYNIIKDNELNDKRKMMIDYIYNNETIHYYDYNKLDIRMIESFYNNIIKDKEDIENYKLELQKKMNLLIIC